jgi:hypothetical protein
VFVLWWIEADALEATEKVEGLLIEWSSEDVLHVAELDPCPARGLPLLDLNGFLPMPGGTKKDMLDGVDIRLEGELLLRALGELIFNDALGAPREADVVEEGLVLMRCGTGEVTRELESFTKRGLVDPARLDEDVDMVGVEERAPPLGSMNESVEPKPPGW